MKIRTKARVTVTMHIEVPDAWDSTTRLDLVYEQAKASAIHILTNTLDSRFTLHNDSIKVLAIQSEIER